MLPGDKAFQLHDTYGFPIDLTLEMAAEQGLTVDEDGFRAPDGRAARSAPRRTRRQRKVGHGDGGAYRSILDDHGVTDFLGYTRTARREATVVGLLVERRARGRRRATGAEVEVVLDRTPFYAEGGGQLADTGRIVGDGVRASRCTTCSRRSPGLNVHRGKVVVRRGAARRDRAGRGRPDRGGARCRGRTPATHLVHAGVRRALGTQAAQAGSLNAPGRLRFDFTSPGGAVPPSVLADVEDEVNDVLLQRLRRARRGRHRSTRRASRARSRSSARSTATRSASSRSATTRKELCGGTHVHRSGEIGVVKLLSEASIGAGVRRVEALVGLDAFRFLAREHVLVGQLAEQFKVPRRRSCRSASGRPSSGCARRRRSSRSCVAPQLLSSAGTLADAAEDVDGTALVAVAAPDGVGGNDLRALASEVRNRLGARPGVVALFSADGAKVSFVVATTSAARDRGLAAGKLVPAFAPGDRRPRRRQARPGPGRRQQPGGRPRSGRPALRKATLANRPQEREPSPACSERPTCAPNLIRPPGLDDPGPGRRLGGRCRVRAGRGRAE